MELSMKWLGLRRRSRWWFYSMVAGVARVTVLRFGQLFSNRITFFARSKVNFKRCFVKIYP